MQRHDFHMEDGPEQEARDEIFRSQIGKEPTEPLPSRWSVQAFSAPKKSSLTQLRTCPVIQPWIYGYDAIAEAEKALKSQKISAT